MHYLPGGVCKKGGGGGGCGVDQEDRITKLQFFFISQPTYVAGTQKNHLNEMVLNIC